MQSFCFGNNRPNEARLRQNNELAIQSFYISMVTYPKHADYFLMKNSRMMKFENFREWRDPKFFAWINFREKSKISRNREN